MVSVNLLTNAQWQQVDSIYGGSIQCLASGGNNIFAGTNYGIYLSTDTGNSWTDVNIGLTKHFVKSITINGSDIFAVTSDTGIFLSTNNGRNWTLINKGITSASISSVVVCGSDIFAGTADGVFVSSNKGSTWSPVNNGFPSKKNITVMAVCGSKIFAGTFGEGIFTSDDNGLHWESVNNGIDHISMFINSLAVDSNNIYTGIDCLGVYKMECNGKNWTKVSEGMVYNCSANAFVFKGKDLYAGTNDGVYKTSNSGSKWKKTSEGMGGKTITALTFSGGTFFAGTKSGLFISTDQGKTWKESNNGLKSVGVNSITSYGKTLFTGTQAGFYVSKDEGQKWEETKSVSDWIKLSVTEGENVFKVDYFDLASLSTDSGKNWTVINEILPSKKIYAIAMIGTNLLAATNAGVSLITDNGKYWKDINNGLPVIRETGYNYGSSFGWEDTYEYTYYRNTPVEAIAADENNIYALLEDRGIFKSSDNGENWIKADSGMPSYAKVNLLAVCDNKIYAGTDKTGVFVSVNKGESWAALGYYFPAKAQLSSLIVFDKGILAGTSQGLYFLASDNSKWTTLNPGLTDRDIKSMAVSENFLFIGTGNYGLWKMPLSEIGDRKTHNSELIDKSNILSDIEMVYVEGGSYTMGCTSEQGLGCYSYEKPFHNVTISSFNIGKYEVTQQLWKSVMGSNPSKNSSCEDCPVENVNWYDIQDFIKKIDSITGKNYRLPTEAEWEYAARGGIKSKGFKYCGSNTFEDVAWSNETSGYTSHEVGQKYPNELGIYDMSGNVWEWCSDWFGDYTSETQINPDGPSSGTYRVLRGGCWYYSGETFCRTAYRSFSSADYRTEDFGFRLVSDKQ